MNTVYFTLTVKDFDQNLNFLYNKKPYVFIHNIDEKKSVQQKTSFNLW